MDKVRELIDTTNLLKNLKDEDKEKIAKSLHTKNYKRGDYIFRPRDEAAVMYIIKKGSMKISMDLTDGREQILYIYNKEDFVGGLNLLTSDKYHYNGIALADTEVITISKEDFGGILLYDRDFLRSMLEQSFTRIRKSEELIDRLCVINGDMKVAKGLLNLIKTHGERAKDGKWVIVTHLNRTELGSYTGLARETLTRKLAYFQEMGYVELMPKGEIKILDEQALTDLTI